MTLSKRKKATVKKVIKGLSKASKTHANQANKLKKVLKGKK
tara:strand:- start:124 stop:246 length:123 start_codon:yes stop_codon:yes gene_type:complete